MDTIIAYRVNGGKVQMITEEDGDIAIFSNRDRAILYANANPLFPSGQADYQVIVLDEL